MLIDARMKFMEDEVFAVNVASGTIDLYGTDIAIAPDSELRKKHGRGSGSAVLVHAVVSPGGVGVTAPGGTVTAILKIDDADPAVTTVATVVLAAALWSENAGVHMVFAIPYDAEGRYATLDVNDAALTGLGDAPTCTAFIFVQ